MKQIILPFRTGEPVLEDVPAPVAQPGEVLIRTKVSIVSTGTERMLMSFGKAGWIGKARQQPERLKQVMDKIRTDGFAPTVKALRGKLEQPVALGYSQSGVVIGIGDGVTDVRVGDRVASNGPHAQIVSVPRNLVVKIPDGVSDEAAAFTVLGAIALQGIRLAEPTFGETVVVLGLGIIGQLTAQLLLANGCRVIGVEPQPARLERAAATGITPLAIASGDAVRALTGGHGADAAIITTSSDSDDIINQAADMCRKRGRIVLTGVAGMKFSRDLFFKKELSFQVSTSYGPGRYEPAYEQRGLDYPIAYVRWTEGRNFDAVLQAMAMQRIDVSSLITVRKPVQDFATLYTSLSDPAHLAGALFYDDAVTDTAIRHTLKSTKAAPGAGIGVIGAGAFATGSLLPALKAAGAPVSAIVSRSGLSATTLARKFGIAVAGTDPHQLLKDELIGAVIIATPHNTHASLTAAALDAGRHVLVEKPLALSRAEVAVIDASFAKGNTTLTVGFNRRMAPMAVAAKNMIAQTAGPVAMVMTVNAGPLPRTHWLQDAQIGGGRITGEACHFIDLCAYFADSAIIAVCANALGVNDSSLPESAAILLRFANGSSATVNYLSNGSKAYDKERVELYRAGCTVVIENWRQLRSFGFRKDVARKAAQDKGHHALIGSWVRMIATGGAPLMEPATVFNSALATIAVSESIAQGGWVSV